MAFLIYDGSFEGFLTVVFECYSQKIIPTDICKESNYQENLFEENQTITTNEEKSSRVWKALYKKLHAKNKDLPYTVFLSNEAGIEMKLYRFIRRIFDSHRSIETDFGDQDVLQLKKIKRQVMREAMRMMQFIRFQQTKDNIYFAAIEPEYDVLPLVLNHFKNRFADQHWLIYDLLRDYGFYYNLHNTQEVTLTEKTFSETNGKVNENILEEKEETYQILWKSYFDHINIKERKNLKLQRQHMPKRFWKFLPEKSPLL